MEALLMTLLAAAPADVAFLHEYDKNGHPKDAKDTVGDARDTKDTKEPVTK